jgi:hypothetical protein
MPFFRICLHATYSNKIKGNEGITNFLARSLSRQYNCPFLVEKYVTIEAALVNSILPDALQPTVHPHDSTFM